MSESPIERAARDWSHPMPEPFDPENIDLRLETAINNEAKFPNVGSWWRRAYVSDVSALLAELTTLRAVADAAEKDHDLWTDAAGERWCQIHDSHLNLCHLCPLLIALSALPAQPGEL